ncbi:MAG TPA: DUF2330 domain-containing protein [Candidatus Limnocylindrales bacterium]|nr:DUF2330 domain-containing protein [Candidatus Limnocylindrales bacterium]
MRRFRPDSPGRFRRRARFALTAPIAAVAIFFAATPALACGGLIGPNGAVNLLRTTTLAGYHDGVEHYVTAFQFAGGGGAFGSITPLPGVPTSVEKGGDWTLQRLVRETSPLFDRLAAPSAAASAGAVELMTVKIDALDITVLKGGAADIGTWATKHGFRLPPDAPEVLDFYAERSQIFLAAAFDADAARARGQQVGDGTPVHITIPTDNPWVPLRILALGKTAAEPVQADVYLLTDHAPALLPAPTGSNGIRLDASQSASTALLDDLRSDRGMEWIPRDGWLTKVGVDGTAGQLGYDLAVDASGAGRPSAVDAGLALPHAAPAGTPLDVGRLLLALAFVAAGLVGVTLVGRSRQGHGPTAW